MVKFRWEKDFKRSNIGNLMIDSNDTGHYIFSGGLDGEVTQDWSFESIAKDFNVNSGQRVSPGEEGAYPVYGASGFSGYDKNFLIEEEALITGRVGTIGEVFYVREKNSVSDNALYITKKSKDANIKFLYFILKLVFQNIEDVLNVGTTQPLIKQSEVKKFILPFPEPQEQSRIASVLSWFDDLIENKKRQNELLEETAEALFKSWFIDFEPFKKEKFKNSEMGKIPKGWEVKPISEIADIGNGVSYNGREKFVERVDGSYIFVTLNNAIEGGGFKPEYAWIKSDRIKEKHFVEEGDLIIPNTEQTKDERLLGSPGLVFFPPDYNEKKGVYSHHITKISPSDPRYISYLYLFLKFTREDTSSFHTGTGVLGLDIKNFRANKIIICPSMSVLEKFHSLTEPLFAKIIKNHKQIMVIRKIKNTLLPLLVFGRLRVEEI
jgi:type I restriction enzyme S subunit